MLDLLGELPERLRVDGHQHTFDYGEDADKDDDDRRDIVELDVPGPTSNHNPIPTAMTAKSTSIHLPANSSGA